MDSIPLKNNYSTFGHVQLLTVIYMSFGDKLTDIDELNSV